MFWITLSEAVQMAVGINGKCMCCGRITEFFQGKQVWTMAAGCASVWWPYWPGVVLWQLGVLVCDSPSGIVLWQLGLLVTVIYVLVIYVWCHMTHLVDLGLQEHWQQGWRSFSSFIESCLMNYVNRNLSYNIFKILSPWTMWVQNNLLHLLYL